MPATNEIPLTISGKKCGLTCILEQEDFFNGVKNVFVQKGDRDKGLKRNRCEGVSSGRKWAAAFAAAGPTARQKMRISAPILEKNRRFAAEEVLGDPNSPEPFEKLRVIPLQ